MRVRLGGPGVQRLLSAGGVGLRHVRRQLQLARSGLVPDQPGHSARPASSSIAITATAQGRMPDRLRSEDEPARGRRARSARGSQDLHHDEHGRRPVFGGIEKFQTDPHWQDLFLFYEYFHGDNGAGIGASHQTGWTGSWRSCSPSAAPFRRGRARPPAPHGSRSIERLPGPRSTRSTRRSGLNGWPAVRRPLRSLRPGRGVGHQVALPVDAVWLMGVWERSPAGRGSAQTAPGLDAGNQVALPDLTDENVSGRRTACEAIRSTRSSAAPKRSPRPAAQLADLGLRLILDYVPNHVAPDHPCSPRASILRTARRLHSTWQRDPAALLREWVTSRYCTRPLSQLSAMAGRRPD